MHAPPKEVGALSMWVASNCTYTCPYKHRNCTNTRTLIYTHTHSHTHAHTHSHTHTRTCSRRFYKDTSQALFSTPLWRACAQNEPKPWEHVGGSVDKPAAAAVQAAIQDGGVDIGEGEMQCGNDSAGSQKRVLQGGGGCPEVDGEGGGGDGSDGEGSGSSDEEGADGGGGGREQQVGTHTHTLTHIHTCNSRTQTCVLHNWCVLACTNIHTHAHTQAHTLTHTSTHTRIHTHTYTHVYTHMHSFLTYTCKRAQAHVGMHTD